MFTSLFEQTILEKVFGHDALEPLGRQTTEFALNAYMSFTVYFCMSNMSRDVFPIFSNAFDDVRVTGANVPPITLTLPVYNAASDCLNQAVLSTPSSLRWEDIIKKMIDTVLRNNPIRPRDYVRFINMFVNSVSILVKSSLFQDVKRAIVGEALVCRDVKVPLR